MKKKRAANKIDMRQMFLDLQETMKKRLQTLRRNIKHAPTKGEGAETVWIKFLQDYLPKRYSVAKAIVIDFEGNTSDAIDVVIYDTQYTPFIFNESGVKYIPSESVYAIFEAKQKINKNLLEYASDKIESVRRLHKTVAPVVDKGITKPAPIPFIILGGFLCLENGWSKSINEANPFKLCVEKLIDNKLINIGCVLNDKSFINEMGNNIPKTKYSSNDEALIFFFLKLVSELQKLGTVRPIDLNRYIGQLNS